MITRTRKKARAADAARARTEVSIGTLATLGAASAIIGLWSVACLVGGLIAGGGPVGLMKGWFTAVSGA